MLFYIMVGYTINLILIFVVFNVKEKFLYSKKDLKAFIDVSIVPYSVLIAAIVAFFIACYERLKR